MDMEQRDDDDDDDDDDNDGGGILKHLEETWPSATSSTKILNVLAWDWTWGSQRC
jgi:hypothetical protein